MRLKNCTLSKEVKRMPNIKSAKKRVLVIEKKTLQNKMFKSAFKTIVKKYEAAVAAGALSPFCIEESTCLTISSTFTEFISISV